MSQRSAEIFGRSSGYFIPHNLYYDLEVPWRCPSIQQFVALSRISNYRLSDWLAVFGFHLDQITRVQPLFPRKHTVPLDSSLYDENAWVPWFTERPRRSPIPAIAPMGQLLLPGTPRRAKDVVAQRSEQSLYIKVGEEDLLAFPDLLPGSIARVDTRRNEAPGDSASAPTPQIFVVEDEGRLYCGRLQRVSKDQLILCSSMFPFVYRNLGIDSTAKIRGVVDVELRPLVRVMKWPFLFPADGVLIPGVARHNGSDGLKHLLSSSRIRTGLSFREASSLSQHIAQMLGDRRYFASPGTLSDYETMTQPPRQIHKIVSLCILYCITFWDFLHAAGLHAEFKNGDPIPDDLILRPSCKREASTRTAKANPDREATGCLRTIIDQWQQLRSFATDALANAAGLRDVSVSDVFWMGGEHNAVHPYLANALFAVINRRCKKPERSAARMLWEQPLYLLLLRDGRFLCGACTLEDNILSIHPYPDRSLVPRKLRNQVEAEVIGQVTALVRRLT